ncbi:hypothetical protein ACRC7T_01120 [Segnochrobactraceae bacterium EtOH-i3]
MAETVLEIHQIIPAHGWHFYNKMPDTSFFEPILCFALVSVLLTEQAEFGPQKKIIGISALDYDIQQLVGSRVDAWRTNFIHHSDF